MNLELEADGSDFRGNPEVPRRLVAVRGPSDPGAAFWGLDSGAKCNRAKQTGFARLCQAL
jgi:hypothetical protein